MSDVEYTVITGAAKRMGRAIALHLAGCGHDIAIHYHHSEEEARSLQDEIERMGRQALLIQADLRASEDVASIIDAVLEAGRIRALVNNASIFECFDTHSTTLDAWQRSLAVNLTAPFLLSQAYATHSSSGRIVNLLDWRTERSDRDHLPYAVSKAALEALARNLAADLAPLFQVNGLALGAVRRPQTARRRHHTGCPAKRWAAIERWGGGALPARGAFVHHRRGTHPRRRPPSALGGTGMDKIIIKDLTGRGIIGINEWERTARQEIVMNITLFADLSRAAKSDSLAVSPNYRTIAKALLACAEDSERFTVEALAEDLAAICLKEEGVERVIVRVEKPGALRFSTSVGVEIERAKEASS